MRTVGSVVRIGGEPNPTGIFYRLYDLPTERKESGYIDTLSDQDTDVQREFSVELNEFAKIPRTPICYSTPSEIRDLYSTDQFIDADQAGIQGDSIGDAVSGLVTGGDSRFVRRFWETENNERFQPLAYGGSDAWITPKIQDVVEWGEDGSVIKRSSVSARTPNDEFYGHPGLTWTRIKDTARRFGYYGGGLFETSSFMLFPADGEILWNLLAALNSDLYTSLFLSQTPEKEWDADVLGCLPWNSELENISELETSTKKQYRLVVEKQIRDPTSPYYIHPPIYPETDSGFFYSHPHTDLVEDELDLDRGGNNPDSTILEASRLQNKRDLRQQKQLEQLSQNVSQSVFDAVDLSQESREAALTEIFLRTSESPEDREIPDPDSVPETPENIEQQVKDLVHHFAMEAVRKEDDGIIPLHGVDGQPNMLDRIVERFEDAYGEHAEDRLVEVDEILGAESATEEAYPNLRAWIEDDLFDYHVNRMENTPIVWKLTTERLLADSTGEGFACFLDYHSLDSGLFDRLSNQYLEPRKAELREQRSAANRRRSDESLSASEQAEAAEQYERCASGLDQIAVFEDVVQELGSVDEREFDESDRALVEDLAPKVAVFREEARERVDTLEELHERKDSTWFKDTFSEKFWETVDEWRDEWLDALAELEGACEAYAKPTDEPVEAHLADLFDYFNWRLKGSDHYSSSGILFMTYYFEREGSDLLNENGQPHDHLSEDERRLASLARGLDDVSIVDEEYLEAVADDKNVDDIEDLPPLAEFKALAEEIDDRCQTIDKRVPSDWADRALSEITTAGYQPNHKHGVEINITPLADAEIVPKTVDDNAL